MKFGTNGTVLGSWAHGPATRRTPAALAVGSSGKVFVADPSTGTVSKYSPNGKQLARCAGFTHWFTVPQVNSSSLGTPIALAWQKPDSLHVRTRCRVSVTCNYYNGLRTKPYLVDALLRFRVSGTVRGYPAVGGTPQGVPYKESDPFVTIDALASDPAGRAYVAGTVWERGGTPQRVVIGYTSLGYKWG